MKLHFLSLLALIAFATPSTAFELSPGKPFPQITLPEIRSGEKVALEDRFGEKLMLHLFASW